MEKTSGAIKNEKETYERRVKMTEEKLDKERRRERNGLLGDRKGVIVLSLLLKR